MQEYSIDEELKIIKTLNYADIKIIKKEHNTTLNYEFVLETPKHKFYIYKHRAGIQVYQYGSHLNYFPNTMSFIKYLIEKKYIFDV
jgi:ribosomal protein S2